MREKAAIEWKNLLYLKQWRYEYMEKNAFLYTTLLTAKGVPAFRNQLLKMMQQSLHEQIDMSGINQRISKDVLVNFVTSAAVGVIEWWFTNSMPYSAEEITEQLWELLERNQIVPQPLASIQANAVKCK